MRSLFCLISLCLLLQIASAQKKVACVGNSVTFGYLVPNRETNCYPAQLQRMLGEGYLVGNFGHSGATLLRHGHKPYVQTDEFKRALEMKADIVVIHLGLNDTDPRNWPNYGYEFRKDYFALIDTFRKVNPNAQVLICRMSPIMSNHWRFKSGTRDWYWLIQKEIEEVAAFEGVQLIDLQAPLYHRPDLLPDALHPDAEGAELISRAVYQSITKDYGGLQLPVYYSDNMVLQRGDKITFSGIANANSTVEITLTDTEKNQTYTAEIAYVRLDGTWRTKLNHPFKAGGNYRLSIQSGEQSVTYNNVTFGDVWICSGQSNMAWTVAQSNGGKEFAAQFEKGTSRLRLFNMQPTLLTDAVEWDSTKLSAINRLEYYRPARWEEANTQNILRFSAIAASFGYDLSKELDVPIGLVHNAVGGSGTESWIDRRSIEHNPALCDMLNNWLKSDFIMDWSRGRAAQNIAKSKNPRQRHPYQPCYLFESGIYPLRDIGFKGFIWYQGESNAHNAELHEILFRSLVESWRTNFTNGANAPFLFAQLSSINRPSWPQFRDSQRKLAEEIPNVAMIVTSDKGDSLDVHPREKRVIGERFARVAMNRVYGKKNVEWSGPVLKKVKNLTGHLILSFDHAKGLTTSDGLPVQGFEVEQVDGLYYPAQGQVISGGKVVVTIPNPFCLTGKVRYGYQPFSKGNLINGAGLPTSTFSR